MILRLFLSADVCLVLIRKNGQEHMVERDLLLIGGGVGGSIPNHYKW